MFEQNNGLITARVTAFASYEDRQLVVEQSQITWTTIDVRLTVRFPSAFVTLQGTFKNNFLRFLNFVPMQSLHGNLPKCTHDKCQAQVFTFVRWFDSYTSEEFHMSKDDRSRFYDNFVQLLLWSTFDSKRSGKLWFLVLWKFDSSIR